MSIVLSCMLLAACGGGSEPGDVSTEINHPRDVTAVSPADRLPVDALPAAAAPGDEQSLSAEESRLAAALRDEQNAQYAAASTEPAASGLGAAGDPVLKATATRMPIVQPGWGGAAPMGGTLAALDDPARGFVAPNRVAREDWEGLRVTARSSPAVERWIAGQRRLVDAWRAESPERADLIGGWIHDYVDPRSGLPLKWTEETPEPPATPGAQDDRLRQAWVMYMRQRNISYALTAARLYRANGDTTYANWAAQQLDFYADNYERWPLRTDAGRARMFRHGLDEAVNAFPLLETARLLSEFATWARQEQWATRLFRPMAENLKTQRYPMTNIGLWHGAAIASVGMRLRDESLIQYALDNPEGIRAVLRYSITADSIWIEGSFGYNAYVIGCLASLLKHASIEGYASRFAAEWDSARQLLLAPLAFRFDDGSLPTPSDATARLQAVDPGSHVQLYRLVPSYWGVNRARESLSWEALLDPPQGFVGSEPALPPATTRDFPTVRMAVLRAGDWQAFVHYGQAVASHAQEEALTYELHQGKTAITSDPGTVTYSSPYHTRYFRRGAAHNVPMIDGEGQSRWRPGTVLNFDAPQARLVVSQPDYNARASAEREYQALATGFVETTSVVLKGAAPSPARIGGAFHTDCTVTPLTGLTGSSGQSLPGSDAMSFWTVAASYTAGSEWSAKLQCGAAAYRLRVSGSGMQRVFMATEPTTPLPNRRSVLYYDTSATRADFRTEITALP